MSRCPKWKCWRKPGRSVLFIVYAFSALMWHITIRIFVPCMLCLTMRIHYSGKNKAQDICCIQWNISRKQFNRRRWSWGECWKMTSIITIELYRIYKIKYLCASHVASYVPCAGRHSTGIFRQEFLNFVFTSSSFKKVRKCSGPAHKTFLSC